MRDEAEKRTPGLRTKARAQFLFLLTLPAYPIGLLLLALGLATASGAALADSAVTLTAAPSATIQEGDVVICFNYRTDRLRELTIAFTQEGRDPLMADWDRVVEVVGHLMEPLDIYPQRFRVSDFPTDEQLAAIGAKTP